MADEWYTHGPVPVYDSSPGAADTIKQNGTGGKFVTVKNGTALPIRDLNGTPITEITSNSDGQSIMFQVQSLYGLVQFGDIINPSTAVEVATKLLNFDAAYAAAQQAVTNAQQAVTSAQQAVAAANSISSGGIPDKAITAAKLADAVAPVNDAASTSSTAPMTAAAMKSVVSALLTTSAGIEQAQDIVGAMLIGGTYNDTAGTYTLPTSSSGAVGDATIDGGTF